MITSVHPRSSLVGLPTWGIVRPVAGYALLADLIQNHARSLRALRWKSVADLPVTALAYLLAGEPGGPLFVLFILAIDCAAASMTTRGTLLYAAAATAGAAFIDLVLLLDAASGAALPDLSTRLVVLALAGVGTAVVMRPLLLEREVARSARGEAAWLAELDRLRADFVASVSHDLRTPLTAWAPITVLARPGPPPLRRQVGPFLRRRLRCAAHVLGVRVCAMPRLGGIGTPVPGGSRLRAFPEARGAVAGAPDEGGAGEIRRAAGAFADTPWAVTSHSGPGAGAAGSPIERLGRLIQSRRSRRRSVVGDSWPNAGTTT